MPWKVCLHSINSKSSVSRRFSNFTGYDWKPWAWRMMKNSIMNEKWDILEKLSFSSKLIESILLIASTTISLKFNIDFDLYLQLPRLDQLDLSNIFRLYLQNVPHEKLDSRQINSITSFVNKPVILEKIIDFAAFKATSEDRKLVNYMSVIPYFK